MADKIYPKGIVTFPPNEKAPEFVLGSVAITIDDLVDYLNGEGRQYMTDYNGKRQIKLQVLKSSKDKGVYFTVDTFKPTPKQQTDGTPIHRERAEQENAVPTGGDGSDDLPF